MVIDLKVLVRSFNCESRACYVGNPRESFFFELAKVIFLTTSVCVCGVLTFCWTSAIRLPPSFCLYQLVCINLSASTCLYELVSINLSLSTCLYQLVSINLSVSTCLYQPVSINLSLSTCLYQFVFINLSLVALDAARPLRGRRGTW